MTLFFNVTKYSFFKNAICVFKTIMLSFLLVSIFSCSSKNKQTSSTQTLTSSSRINWTSMPFISHKDWLAVNIDEKPIEDIRKQIEELGKFKLKSRNEAHITVITPPEFAKILKKIPMQAIEDLALKFDLQKTSWKPICVGEAKDPKNAGNSVYFIVVASPGLIELRKQIFKTYISKGGDPTLVNSLQYYPHITIGFIEKDLYESDGVLKDHRTCIFDLTTAHGEKITSWNL